MDNFKVNFLGDVVAINQLKWFNIFVVAKGKVLENYHVQFRSVERHSYGYVVEKLGEKTYAILSGESTFSVVDHDHIYDLIRNLILYDLGNTPYVITPVSVAGISKLLMWGTNVGRTSAAYANNTVDIRVNANGTLYVFSCSSFDGRPASGASYMMHLTDDTYYKVYDLSIDISGSSILHAVSKYARMLYGEMVFYFTTFTILGSVSV